MFSVVISDEAQNMRTLEKSYFRSISDLKARFHVFSSATPDINRSRDLGAYLLLTETEETKEAPPQILGTTDDVICWLEARRGQKCVGAVSYHLFKGLLDKSGVMLTVISQGGPTKDHLPLIVQASQLWQDL